MDALIDIHKPVIIGITEIKPKNSKYALQECEIALKDYQMFHNLDTGHRGICLYIHKNMKPSPADKIDSNFNEHVFAECKRDGLPPLLVGLVYRSPNSNQENNDELNSLFLRTVELRDHDVLVMGDFNSPEINWDLATSEAVPSHPATTFLNVTKEAFLVQHQKEPTRHRPGQKANTVDLIFTSDDGLLEDITTAPPMGKSDHFTIIFSLDMNEKKQEHRTTLNYTKMDTNMLIWKLLDIDWEKEGRNLTVEQYWYMLKNRIKQAVEKSVPKRSAQSRRRQKWMDGGTLTSVRTKHKRFRRWLQTRSGEDHMAYVEARNQATKACRKAKRRLEETVASSAKKNPKAFWSYVKSKTSIKTGMGDLKRDDGSRIRKKQNY